MGVHLSSGQFSDQTASEKITPDAGRDNARSTGSGEALIRADRNIQGRSAEYGLVVKHVE
jgi:hypothetical protein